MAVYRNLAEAATALRQLTGPVLLAAGADAMTGIAIETMVKNVQLSPVGRPQAMLAGRGKARLALRQDRHPGKLRSSWRLSIGAPAYARLPDASVYPVPGAGQGRAALRGFRVGQVIFLSDDARSDRAKRGYADVVALVGRHLDRRGRMIGSLQAPRGTVLPSQEHVAQVGPKIIANAIERAVAKMAGGRR